VQEDELSYLEQRATVVLACNPRAEGKKSFTALTFSRART